jgi:hypothetical protein
MYLQVIGCDDGAAKEDATMRNGERKQVGGATIVCHVTRHSWKRREDRWMGSMAPRQTSSRTWYDVLDASGKSVLGSNEMLDSYKVAVARAQTA